MIISDYVHENETYVYRSPIVVDEDPSTRTAMTIAWKNLSNLL